jgi:peroxiredoxin
MAKVMPNAPTPALSAPLIGGGQFTLSESAPKNFTMVVFYRGLHCPVCKGYLSGLEKLLPQYEERGVDVVAVSMDSEAKASQSKSEWGLTNLPIAYGIDQATARAWGLYLSKSIREGEPGVFNEPGLFLVRPDGKAFFAATANMPWGRPNLEELLPKIDFALEKKYPARGDYA